MYKLKLLATAMLISLFAAAQTEIKVMSYNIRLDVKSDGENWWENRKGRVANLVNYYEADFIGMQEVLHHQLVYLKDNLNGYDYIGVGRDDGKEAGESSCIFYKKDRYTVVQQSTFWLSPTPDVPSKGWDAALNRVCTYGLFLNNKTKQYVWVFNTHFDHIGKIARKESAGMLLKAVDSIAGKTTAIVTGDFNAFPADEPIRIIVDEQNPLHLTDSKPLSIEGHYGPTGTFNGFTSKESSNDPIDYIFFNLFVKVYKHATLSQSWGGRFSSDHFPEWAKILVE